jgi:hypothetical protein
MGLFQQPANGLRSGQESFHGMDHDSVLSNVRYSMLKPNTHWTWLAVGILTFTCLTTLICTAGASHAPIRTRFLRIDTGTLFSPPPPSAPLHLGLYDAAHKRFFISNPTLNRIDVFDAPSESLIGKIAVPSPLGLDLTTEATFLYAGTMIGDVYKIDPAAMRVLQRIPAHTIGSTGYAASRALALADGRLVLLQPPWHPFKRGNPSIAIWNPANNSLDILESAYQSLYQQNFCPGLLNEGDLALSGDRKRVIVSSDNGDALCSYEPTSKQTAVGKFDIGRPGIPPGLVIPTPDGKRFFVTSLIGIAAAFDVNTMQKLGQFDGPMSSTQPPYALGIDGGLMSMDGSTLFITGGGRALAFDALSLAQKGWVPNFVIPDIIGSIVPAAMDETGLIAGPIGHGVAFLDASQIKQGVPPRPLSLEFPQPPTGPLSGGTPIHVGANAGPENALPDLAAAYLGDLQLTGATLTVPASGSGAYIEGTSQATTASGAADFAAILADGRIGLMPESFSYGPTIIAVLPDAASSEGGSQGAVFGYGFGLQASDLQVTIGSSVAPVTGLTQENLPFPMQIATFTIPPKTWAANAAVRVTTSSGSAVSPRAFRYVPSVKKFPLAGAVLSSGIYDPLRRVLYFSDKDQIRRFSPSGQAWLSSIPIPDPDEQTYLYALSLSADCQTLAVSDRGKGLIVLLNPDSPSSSQVFYTQGKPSGLAVTNRGVVYYATFQNGGVGLPVFHKWDPATGQVTNLGSAACGNWPGEEFGRVQMTADERKVYVHASRQFFAYDISSGPAWGWANTSGHDLALSGNGQYVIGDDFLTDKDLRVVLHVSYADFQTWLRTPANGQKLNASGNRMFQPLTNAIDMLDSSAGLLLHRVALPIQVADAYDVMTLDYESGLAYLIADNGIVQVDLNSLEADPSWIFLPLISK